MRLPQTPRELTIRSIILAALGSIVIAGSSTYVALRIGALPWPTIFVAVLSMALLKPFGASLREINVAHTGMSAGGLVAGGLAFTIPGSGCPIPPVIWVFRPLQWRPWQVQSLALPLQAFLETLRGRSKIAVPLGVAAAGTCRQATREGRRLPFS